MDIKKKVLAGALASSLVLSSITPALAGSALSDIEKSYARAEIQALVEAGIISGYPDGTFKPTAQITRAEFAKVLAKALGLQEDAEAAKQFTDVPEWARGYVGAVVKAGYMKGYSDTKFGANDPITREQLAVTFVRAFGYDDEAAELNLNVKFADAAQVSDWAKASVALAAEIGFIKGDGTNFNPKASAERQAVARLAYEFYKNADTYKTTAQNLIDQLTAFKVVSVTAVNAKQLQIKFSKEVDKSTVIDASGKPINITFSRVTNDSDPNKNVDQTKVDNAVLSEDGKTLTLTLNPNNDERFDGTYSITVSSSVKTKDGKELEVFAGTFVASDKTAPTVTAVSYNVITGKVEISFSEPIRRVPDVIRVNGQPVTGASFKSNTNQTVVEFTKPSDVAVGSTATIYVAGSQDAASNQLVPFTGSVVIANDTTPLQVASITQAASNKVKIVFNKSVASNETTVKNATTVLIDGVALSAAELEVARDSSDSSNRTFILTINKSGATNGPDYFYGSANTKTITIVFAADAIVDVFGNKLAAYSQNVTMTKDVAGPTVVSAKVTADGTKIEVAFDEEISASVDASKIVLRKDGIQLNAVGAAKSLETGKEKVLVITPNASDLVNGKLPAGTYTVRLEAGAVQDVNSNKNAATSATVTVAATTTDLTATIRNAQLAGSDVPNKFEVVFSEPVTAASALNPANYTLDGAALPAGTDLYFKGVNDPDNRTVVIELPPNSVNIGAVGSGTTAVLAVKNVQTASGKTVVQTSNTVKIADNTPATLVSAQLVGSNILKLTFDENIASVFNVGDLEISSDAGTFSVTAVSPGTIDAQVSAQSSGKDLIITVTPNDSNWNTVVTGNNLKVKTLDGANNDGLTETLQDANGYRVKAGVQVNVVK